jgi:hypothetical protein
MMMISVECKLWVFFTCVASILCCIRLEIRSDTLGAHTIVQVAVRAYG